MSPKFTYGGDVVGEQGALAADRSTMIERYLPLARKLARRFAQTPDRREDLVQVAALAIVRAVDRRDPARAAEFPAYVVRCVEGELLRHLRDRGSLIRVPRTLPRPIVEPVTLTDFEPCEAAQTLEELSLDRALVARAARALDPRERQIVLERFFLERTQAEVAASLGVSQAHVSRLLETALGKMRRRLGRDESLYHAQRIATLGADELERPARGGARAVAQRPSAPAHAEDPARRAGGAIRRRGRQPEPVHRVGARARGLR
jgi:RNA polymerase sigma-B factor